MPVVLRFAFSLVVLGMTHSVVVRALPTRVLSVDVGFGVPEILALNGQVYAWRRIQIGLGYSYFPGAGIFGEGIALPEQTFTFNNGDSFTMTPVVTPRLSLVSPFVRFFPGEDNFYFQATYSMFRLSGDVRSTFDDPAAQAFADTFLTGTVTLTQAIPTLSIGYLFSGRVFYVNVSLGASWLASLTADLSLNTTLPPAYTGGADQAVLEELERNVQQSADEASRELRRRILFLPSIRVAVGIQL